MAWIALLGLLALELLPSGIKGWWAAAAAVACGFAGAGFYPLALAALGGGLLGGLALIDLTTWVGTCVAWAGFAALVPPSQERRKVLGIAAAVGILFPLLLLGSMAAIDEDARHALRAGLDLGGTLVDQVRRGATLLGISVLSAGVVRFAMLSHAPTSKRERVSLLLLASALVACLAMRWWWIVSVASLPTDMLIWSERPFLVNLLKLRAGETFYGPIELINSYSYSPGLELLQYTLLRPFGLELSLRAHRLLGLFWHLFTSAILIAALRAALGKRLSPYGVVLLAASVIGVATSSLLAPHVHPDHAMMVCFAGALWLVVDDVPLNRRRVGLLLAIPVFATTFKLTGAGVGLGLGLAYLWQRDLKRLLVLALAGALALATIPLFDATLGSFSRYAIRLQASHPMEWGKVWHILSTPSGKVWALSLVLLAVRWRFAPSGVTTRKATRAALLTAGFGVTSLIAYAKHGGQQNSLLPLALGGLVVVVLCSLGDEAASSAPNESPPLHRFAPTFVAGLSLAVILVVTPRFEPITRSSRADLLDMHERQVAWLEEGTRRHLRFWSSSVAAYLDAGQREVPRDVLSSAVELELGREPAFLDFARRLTNGTYDGLTIQNSQLVDGRGWRWLTAGIRGSYRVVGPPELRGQWPKGNQGYVLLERASSKVAGAPP